MLPCVCRGYLQSGEHQRVRESHLSVVIVCRPNRSDATDVFVRRPLSGTSQGLTDNAVAQPLSTADVEGRHRRMRWIETKPINIHLRLIDLDGDSFYYVTYSRLTHGCVNRRKDLTFKNTLLQNMLESTHMTSLSLTSWQSSYGKDYLTLFLCTYGHG